MKKRAEKTNIYNTTRSLAHFHALNGKERNNNILFYWVGALSIGVLSFSRTIFQRERGLGDDLGSFTF